MKYFSPETSKKLEEMGLESVFGTYETDYYSRMTTLDICEIENAKKLWGAEELKLDEWKERIEKDWEWQEKHNTEFRLLVDELGKTNQTREEIDDWTKRYNEHNSKRSPYFIGDEEFSKYESPKGVGKLLTEYITLSDEERVKYVEDYLDITSDKT